MKSVTLLFVGLMALPAFSHGQEVTAVEMNEAATKIRKQHGLSAQQLDQDLVKLAYRWAERLAKTGRLSHGGGEQIIAMGYRSTDSVFKAWMRSSGHRSWILSRTTRCGWACKRSKSGRLFWVGAFRK